MKKRLLSILLILGLALPLTACAASAAQGTETEVEAEGEGLCGYPTAETLAGDADITRGAFLDLLAAASGDDLAENSDLDLSYYFTDGADASDGVKWAFAKWLVSGQDGALHLNDPLTREEAAAILGRYLDYRYTELPGGCGTGAPDMSDVAAWAQHGVMQCWMYGVMELTSEQNVSYPDGTSSSALAFRPQAGVTAAEARAWAANAQKLTVSAIFAPDEKGFADSLTAALDADGSWSLSPYSVRLCLAMLANGALGATRQELLDALQISDLDAYNAQVKEQLARYDSYARVLSLETANSLWLNQSVFGGKGVFLPAFTARMQDDYRAETAEVTSADSVERVNAWVKDKTHGKIAAILDENDRGFAAALVNAVYFKAVWAEEFDPRRTEKGDFIRADGSKTELDFMHRTDHVRYYSTPGVEAVGLDFRRYAVDNEQGDNWEYFRDADFSMYFVKTADKLDVQDLLDRADFTNAEVRLSIPKFKVEYGAALDETLTALGVQAAYDPNRADLSAMIDPAAAPGGQLYLDTVLHKTYLAIDEKGAEAAAVTAAVADRGAALEERPPLVRSFTADRPFYFAIRDNTNGELLFVGRYEG